MRAGAAIRASGALSLALGISLMFTMVGTSALAQDAGAPCSVGADVELDFPPEWRLYAQDTANWSTSHGPMAVSIPAGTYDVALASADDHLSKPDQVQLFEQWFVQLFNSNGDLIFTSNMTPDLPEDVDFGVWVVNTNVVLAEEATAATVVHSFANQIPGPESVQPVCALFAQVVPPTTTTTPPATTTPPTTTPPTTTPPTTEPPTTVPPTVSPTTLVTTTQETLPFTGFSGPGVGGAGLALILGGASLLLLARRRHRSADQPTRDWSAQID